MCQQVKTQMYSFLKYILPNFSKKTLFFRADMLIGEEDNKQLSLSLLTFLF